MFHDKELFTVCPNRHPARTTSPTAHPSLDDLPIKASRDRSAVSHTIPNDLLDSSGGSPALTARHTDAEDGPSAAHAHIDFSKVPPADPALHTRRKSGLPARPRWYARWVGTGCESFNTIVDMRYEYSYSEGCCMCRTYLSLSIFCTTKRICSGRDYLR